MEAYTLPQNIDLNKLFITMRSELEGRIDPNPYHFERINAIAKLKNSNEIVKLSDVVKSVKTITSNISEADIYVGLENIVSDTGEYVPLTEKQTISSAGVFKKGQILFPKLRPYLNKVFLAEFDGLCSTEFHIFDSSIYKNEFLTIYLRCDLIVDQTKHLMTGNTLPRLQTEDVYKLPVPKIPIEKQETIIDYYRAVYNQKQQKEVEARLLMASIDSYLLNELGIILIRNENSQQTRIFSTSFKHVTGGRLNPLYYNSDLTLFEGGKYEMQPLNNIVNNFKTGIGAGKQEQALDGNGYIQIRPTNIDENGELIFARNVYLPFDFKSEKLEVDDVLFNNTNSQELVGKTAIVKINDTLFFSNHITVLQANKKVIIPDYLWYILNSFQKHRIFYSICTNWNNQSGVGTDLLKRLKIPLPPIEKQNEIVDHISYIRCRAKQLQTEATTMFRIAKTEVEKQILGI